MTTWLLLAGAIASEVAASLSLKGALDQPVWYVLVVAGYACSFALLAAVLRRGFPLGVAYGIWGAVGVAATALLAAVIFGEALTPLMLAGMALIIGGVLCVELGSQQAVRRAAARGPRAGHPPVPPEAAP
ncbi:DMT family transporter [Cryobacterium soli]|uniref:DMT family transporter n=1 Tax=Cryobacterium soli TaxID=2220095 RepID=UPI000E71E8E0|nr:SMR family transporter [Cryobacterium soli]